MSSKTPEERLFSSDTDNIRAGLHQGAKHLSSEEIAFYIHEALTGEYLSQVNIHRDSCSGWRKDIEEIFKFDKIMEENDKFNFMVMDLDKESRNSSLVLTKSTKEV